MVAAARNKAVAASWLDRSRRGVEGAAEGAVAAAEGACEPAAVEAVDPPDEAVPMTLEMPSAIELRARPAS